MKKITNVCLYIMLVSCSSLNPFSGGVDLDEIPLTEGEIPFKLPPGVYTDVEGAKHNTSDERWSISEEYLFQGIVKEEGSNFWWYLASGLVAGLGAKLLIGKRKPS